MKEKPSSDGLERRIRELEGEVAELKRREGEWNDRSQRYANLFNGSHAAMLLIDPATAEIVDANPSACRFYGCPREHLKKMRITDINTLPEDEMLRLMRMEEEERNPRFVFRHRLADGEVRDVEVHSGPVLEAGRRLLLSIIHDVTDKNRAEKALSRSEEIFHALAESTSVAIFIIQGDSMVYANQACEKMSGYSREEIGSRPYWLFFLQENGNGSSKNVSHKNRPWRRHLRDEVKMVTKTGEFRWLQYAATRIEYGGMPALLGSAVDVTPRREAEERLRRAYENLEMKVLERTAELAATNARLHGEIEERKMTEDVLHEHRELLQTLVDRIPVMVSFYDSSGRIKLVNREFERLMGYSRKERGEDLSFQEQVRDTVFRVGAGWGDLPVRVGGTRDLFTAWTSVRLSDGSIIGIGMDLTADREAKRALERSERELRSLSVKLLSAQEQERTRIARDLHDGIGQTLALIRIMLGNTQEQVQAEASVHQSLQRVRDIAAQALDELRTIISGLRPPVLDHLGILATITSLCREFQETYKNIHIHKSITLQEKDIPESLKVVIYRVVQEALNNIATHSNAGNVVITLQLLGERIHLEIRDNGRGFDLQDALSLEGIPKGLGIGSMKERVESSGGYFLLKPAKGQGTTIAAYWPVYSVGQHFSS